MTGRESEAEYVLDGAGYDGGGVDRAGSAIVRRRPRLIAAVAVGVIAVAVAGVALVRGLDLIPLSPPPDLEPAPGLLDAGGLGEVRLGQNVLDFLESGCDGNCPDSAFGFIGRDSRRDCTQYPITAPGYPIGSWVWVRDSDVVAVGVTPGTQFAQLGPMRPEVQTWTGLTLGSSLRPRPDELDRWEQDAQAPVPVLRREHDGVVTTLADTTGDGRLDYATVATVAGEECRPNPDEIDWSGPPDELVEATDPIVGGSLAGVTIGVTADEVLRIQGWSPVGFGDSPPPGWREGCRALSSGGATAYAVDGVVVGLQAFTVQDGPTVGMPLEEAAAFLDPATRTDSLPWRDYSPAGGRAGTWGTTWGTVTGTDDTGRQVTIIAVRAPGRVAGIDVPVTAPAALERPAVTGVVVGSSCWEYVRG